MKDSLEIFNNNPNNHYFDYYDMGLSFLNVHLSASVFYNGTMWKDKPWLAWVKGKNPKTFKKELEFVNGEVRPIEMDMKSIVFMLDQGKIYEYRNFSVDYNGHVDSGFFGLNMYGLMNFTKDQVNKWLYGRAKKK